MTSNPTPVLPPDVSADDAEIRWTTTGRPFVRTPDERFANLPDSLEPQDLEFPHVISPGGGMGLFEAWATYALVGRDFMPSVVMRASVNIELSEAELAAYDAPFPSRIHMAGPRTFPSLVNTIQEDAGADLAAHIADWMHATSRT